MQAFIMDEPTNGWILELHEVWLENFLANYRKYNNCLVSH
jgi:ATPase subunit of ABC transporter with duplicated ATPase domains